MIEDYQELVNRDNPKLAKYYPEGYFEATHAPLIRIYGQANQDFERVLNKVAVNTLKDEYGDYFYNHNS